MAISIALVVAVAAWRYAAAPPAIRYVTASTTRGAVVRSAIATGTVNPTLTAIVGWPAPLSLTAICGGFAFSAAVGIFFGLYPARRAAGLNPIDALRYE